MTLLFVIALVGFVAALIFAVREAHSAAESRRQAEELRKQMTGEPGCEPHSWRRRSLQSGSPLRIASPCSNRLSGSWNRAFALLRLKHCKATARCFLIVLREQIENVVAPVRETLTRFDQNVQKLEVSRAEAYGSLTQQIQHLMQSQVELRNSTDQLKNALRAPQHRGRWGEIQLRRVVELAGMLAHCDFHEQQTLFGDRNLRPRM